MRRSKSHTVTQLACAAAVVAISCAGTHAAEFHINTDAPRRVAFVSDAPIESFEGVTESIDGYLVLPGESLTNPGDLGDSEFYFEVDLISLDTGIGLRNRHMRENYLHTDKHPYATYAGTIKEITSLSDTTFLAHSQGDLTIHGVKQSREMADTVTVRDGRFYVAVGFPVALPDHDIEVPKLMFLKINEVVQLHLTFELQPAGQEE